MSILPHETASFHDRLADHPLKEPLLSVRISEIPQNPITVSFNNITYAVKVKPSKQTQSAPQISTKTILHNVTGTIKAGQVAAILGPSGAGKTSLLNIIACRVKKTQGSLTANQIEYDYKMFGDFANYVMQSDVLMPTLTVKETLMFAADLRLVLPQEEKQRKVYELAKCMKLLNCMDVLVGGLTIKGISGGQKKRTSIAFELISDPQVIVLDEPTSGLDSLTSYVIVDYLSQLAHQQGKTVLMTIHQPNSDIFNKFDRLFLMVQGRIIYQGRAEQAIDYFSKNFKLQCRQFENPAEFLIEHVHHQNQDNADRYSAYFQVYSRQIAPKIEQEIREIPDFEVVKRIIEVSLLISFGALLKRTMKNLWRNPMLIKSRFIQSIVMGIYVGGVYFGAGHGMETNPAAANAMIGFMFFISIGSLMMMLSPVTLVFPTQREVFLKEESSRLYSTLSYFISKNLVEIPYMVLMPILSIVIFYWMVGLASTLQQFFLFYLIGFLISICGNSLGMFLGSIINDHKSVSAVTPLVVVPFILFSGFFKNGANLPDWVGWIQYISPIKYGFEANTINQIGQDNFIVAELNFKLGFWSCAGYLVAVGAGFSLLSLLTLWMLRNRLQ